MGSWAFLPLSPVLPALPVKVWGAVGSRGRRGRPRLLDWGGALWMPEFAKSASSEKPSWTSLSLDADRTKTQLRAIGVWLVVSVPNFGEDEGSTSICSPSDWESGTYKTVKHLPPTGIIHELTGVCDTRLTLCVDRVPVLPLLEPVRLRLDGLSGSGDCNGLLASFVVPFKGSSTADVGLSFLSGGLPLRTSSPLVHPSIESTSRPLVSIRSQNLSTIPSPLFSKDLKGSQLRTTRG